MLIDNGAAGFIADHVELVVPVILLITAETSNIALNYVRLDVNGGNGIRSATSFGYDDHVYINVSSNS
ncbi:hypothetical protein LZ023_38645 (plasmid) [Pseudomonas silvicola]|nr:hypothetical protein LZ023_38645 [Pseudomonas silvicola]